MIGLAVESLIRLLFHVFFELFFIGTDEIILYLLTLGKRKPVWRSNTRRSPLKWGVFIDLSFIVGFLFWLLLAWLIFS